MIKLNDNALELMRLVFESGHELFAVGGAVRNSILGLPIEDVDFTTDMMPDEIVDFFTSCGIEVKLGKGFVHGTVTIVSGGEKFDITTYRVDGAYSDNRRPDTVCFSRNLYTDLQRRDFTMNAVCYSPQTGIIDAYGGIADIENRLIRAIGDPKIRFREDILRILRGFRFMSTLDFAMEKETQKAAFECRELLNSISAERINIEMTKLMTGQKPAAAILAMQRGGIMNIIHPEFEPLPASEIALLDKTEDTVQRYRLLFGKQLFVRKLDPKYYNDIITLSNIFPNSRIAKEICIYRQRGKIVEIKEI